MGYQKTNFIEVIDTCLNSLEWYFRTRWLNVGYIRKAQPQEDGHLILSPRLQGEISRKYSFKYTTTCKEMEHRIIPSKEYPNGGSEKILCLHVPRMNEDYIKTWGTVDYVICEKTSADNSHTTIFYLNAPKLINFLTKITESVEIVPGQIYDRRRLVSGIPMEDLIQQKVVEIVDDIYWEKKVVYAQYNISELPIPTQFQKTQHSRFIYLWEKVSEADKEAYWHTFELRMRYADRSLPVIVTALETGKEQRFKSLTEAAAELSKYGIPIGTDAISAVIRGRQKTIKTGAGRVTVRREEI